MAIYLIETTWPLDITWQENVFNLLSEDLVITQCDIKGSKKGGKDRLSGPLDPYAAVQIHHSCFYLLYRWVHSENFLREKCFQSKKNIKYHWKFFIIYWHKAGCKTVCICYLSDFDQVFDLSFPHSHYLKMGLIIVLIF